MGKIRGYVANHDVKKVILGGPAGYREIFFGKYSRNCEFCFGSR